MAADKNCGEKSRRERRKEVRLAKSKKKFDSWVQHQQSSKLRNPSLDSNPKLARKLLEKDSGLNEKKQNTMMVSDSVMEGEFEGPSSLARKPMSKGRNSKTKFSEYLQMEMGRAFAGSSNLNYHYAPPGSKGPLSALGTYPLSSDPRGFPRTYFETSHLSRSPRAVSHPIGMVSLPYSQQPQTSYTLESSYGFENDPYVKTRQQANYFGRGGIYRRY